MPPHRFWQDAVLYSAITLNAVLLTVFPPHNLMAGDDPLGLDERLLVMFLGLLMHLPLPWAGSGNPGNLRVVDKG